MHSTVFKEIIAFLFGRKYYANIIATKGVAKVKLSVYRSSFIFGLCRVQPKIINDVCNAKHIRKYS